MLVGTAIEMVQSLALVGLKRSLVLRMPFPIPESVSNRRFCALLVECPVTMYSEMCCAQYATLGEKASSPMKGNSQNGFDVLWIVVPSSTLLHKIKN